MVDLEAVVELGAASSRDGIEEPVGILHVHALRPEELPRPPMISSAAVISPRRAPAGTATSASSVGRSRNVTSGAQSHGAVERPTERCAHDCRGRSGATWREAHRRRRASSDSLHLTSEGDIFDSRRICHSRSAVFMGPPEPSQPCRRTARPGGGGQGGTRGGRQRFQGDRHCPTTADSFEKSLDLARTGLCPVHPVAGGHAAREPDHTVVRVKLSSRAVRPLVDTSNVSLGKRRCAFAR